MGGGAELGDAICAAASDDSEVARAREYGLLAALLADPPDAALLEKLARIEGNETPLGLAHKALAGAAAAADVAAVAREYFELFIGVGRGELLPYGSYYQTGFLHERPLARLRADLVEWGIERVEGKGEPEDHAAILCEIMAGLIAGEFAVPMERQQYFFDRHLAPWIRRLFADLEAAEAADFYRPVGTTGRVFIEIETQAFAFPA
jgi:TorA maturation chaperone TorD